MIALLLVVSGLVAGAALWQNDSVVRDPVGGLVAGAAHQDDEEAIISGSRVLAYVLAPELANQSICAT